MNLAGEAERWRAESPVFGTHSAAMSAGEPALSLPEMTAVCARASPRPQANPEAPAPKLTADSPPACSSKLSLVEPETQGVQVS